MVVLKNFIIIFIFVLSGCGTSIQTLIELSKNERLKEKTIRDENKSFILLKKAIQNNKLNKGLSTNSVLKTYGKPTLKYFTTDGEQWVYKPAVLKLQSEKIYLFFNKDNNLVKWQYHSN